MELTPRDRDKVKTMGNLTVLGHLACKYVFSGGIVSRAHIPTNSRVEVKGVDANARAKMFDKQRQNKGVR